MIGAFNIENKMFSKLSEQISLIDITDNINKKVDGIILKWIPLSQNELSIKQIQLIEKYVKKMPIIVIDKSMTINSKEYNWLKKFKVKLYEPAVKNRECFNFLPDFIDFSEISFNNESKKYDIAYENDVILDNFEKYYCLLSDKYSIKIPCKIYNISKEKKEVYKKLNIDFEIPFDWKDVSTTVVIGTKKDYKIGNLNVNLFSKIKYGCLPLIPEEHRFFGSLMETLIKNHRDVYYYLGYDKKIRSILLNDVLKRLKHHYPEFTIEYQIDELTNFFKKS